MATLETVAHPFAASLGDQRTSDQRVNFAQFLNAISAILGPQVGVYFLFHGVSQNAGDLTSVKLLYVGIGYVIVCIVPGICLSDDSCANQS